MELYLNLLTLEESGSHTSLIRLPTMDMLMIYRDSRESILMANYLLGWVRKNGRPWYRVDYEKLDFKYNNIVDFLYNPKFVNENPPKLNHTRIVRDKETIDKSFDYFLSLSDL